MRRHLIFSILLMAFLNTNVMANELIDPKSNKEVKNLLVPLNAGEKILLSTEGYPAKSVLFVINIAYGKARDTMREILADSIGISIAHEVVSDEYIKKLDSGDKEVDSIIKKRFNLLEASGIRIDKIKQYVITSNQYNVLKDITGYSLLEIKIIDGKSIFNKECVLLLMRRTDHWRDWGREYHTGIPIPIKGPMEIHCITDTELKKVEELKNKLGIKKMRYFIPESPYSPLLDVDMMKMIKEEIEKF